MKLKAMAGLTDVNIASAHFELVVNLPNVAGAAAKNSHSSSPHNMALYLNSVHINKKIKYTLDEKQTEQQRTPNFPPG